MMATLARMADTLVRGAGAWPPCPVIAACYGIGTLTGNLRKIAEHGRRADNIVKSMLEHFRGGSGEHQKRRSQWLDRRSLEPRVPRWAGSPTRPLYFGFSRSWYDTGLVASFVL